jgi:hypothetical protein
VAPCLVKRANKRTHRAARRDDGSAGARHDGVKHALGVKVKRRYFVRGQRLAVNIPAHAVTTRWEGKGGKGKVGRERWEEARARHAPQACDGIGTHHANSVEFRRHSSCRPRPCLFGMRKQTNDLNKARGSIKHAAVTVDG